MRLLYTEPLFLPVGALHDLDGIERPFSSAHGIKWLSSHDLTSIT